MPILELQELKASLEMQVTQVTVIMFVVKFFSKTSDKNLKPTVLSL